MIVEYSSNNSGGAWWLDDRDWNALEDKGWKVDWFKDQNHKFLGIDANGRWLGGLASRASKEFESEEDAIAEWEEITGQDADDQGCDCCGQPHYFWAK